MHPITFWTRIHFRNAQIDETVNMQLMNCNWKELSDRQKIASAKMMFLEKWKPIDWRHESSRFHEVSLHSAHKVILNKTIEWNWWNFERAKEMSKLFALFALCSPIKAKKHLHWIESIPTVLLFFGACGTSNFVHFNYFQIRKWEAGKSFQLVIPVEQRAEYKLYV